MTIPSKSSLLQSILLSFCIFLIVITSSAAHMLGNETDRVALLTFKSQISPDSQWILSSWNTSSHFCEWEGVACGRRHRRVIELNLSSHGLTGSISPYIGNLSFLRNLSLSDNMLNGQIPQEVGRLSRLQKLDMSNNALSGVLPLNLSQCFNLQILEISMNNLTGKVPEAYASFRKLTGFSLLRNHLIGGIPAFLGNLSSLESLQLADNILTGNIPDFFSHLKNLWFLSLSENMLSGMVPPSLFNTSSLQVIAIARNKIEGSLPQDIGLMLPMIGTFFIGENQLSGSIPISLFTNTSSLGFVALVNNSFSGQIPVEVGRLKSLVYLNLAGNSLGSGGELDDDLSFLDSLNNCTNLQTLDLLYTNLGGKLPISITNLSNTLTDLRLAYTKISGSIPLDIAKLSNLIRLDLAGNALSGVIPMSIAMFSKLQVLDLSDNSLSGHIPYPMENMSSLSALSFSRNLLEGSLVTIFEKCQFLQFMDLGHNHLTGIIPNQLFESCTQILNLDLSHNYFTGSLPVEVGNLKNLVVLDVSENNFSGQIPSTLGSCSSLQVVDLHGNFFHGGIPYLFRNLISIGYMDLSQNNLSGQICKDLERLPDLKKLNLSFNNFEGEVPTKGVFQNTSSFSIVGNDKACGGVTGLYLRNCDIQKPIKKRASRASKMILGVLLPSIFVIMVSLLIVLYSRKRSSAKPTTKEFGKKFPQISYKELYDATSGFSSEMLIGMGSYGCVFKGFLHEYESTIAVKVFNLMARGASKNFVTECQTLRKVRHRNLLKIFTVCLSVDNKGNDFKALVFEFMSYGSLESWLHPISNGHYPSRNTSFLQRLNIAIDIAFALDYLHNHFGTPVVHCDLKPNNVLLNEHMVACLGDFGLAKFLTKSIQNSDTIEESNSMSLRGTIGYIPPEYGMGVDVSTEGDVYSYGILILEMFTGKRPTDPMFNNNTTLRSFCEVNLAGQVMDILDTRLFIEETPAESFLDDIEEQQHVSNEMLDGLVSILKIGVACSSEVIVDRMEIKDVLMKMQAIKAVFTMNNNDIDM